MAGLDATGLTIKRLAEIKEEINDSLRGTFGPAFNLTDPSLLGQWVGIQAERESILWELLEQIFFSQYPDTSEGTSLDNVVAITGIIRRAATKSLVVLDLFGTATSVIPAGSIVSKAGDPTARFVTDIAAVIASGVNEVQTVPFGQAPDTGTWTLDFAGQVTAALAFDITAGALETALEALSTISDVSVSGPAKGPYVITFVGVDGDQPKSPIVVDSNLIASTEVADVTAVADVAGSLDGKTFLLNDAVGSVGFWIDVDDSGTGIPPAAAAANRAIEIKTIVTGGGAIANAIAVAAVINADSEFSVPVPTTATMTVTASAAEDRADAGDVDSGFSFSTTNQGADTGSISITVVETTPGVLPQVAVAATAETAGNIIAPAGSLTVIETPVAGWDSVSNALDAIAGNDIESDAALKARRLLELAVAGRATTEAIRSKVLSVDNVTAAVVFENDTNVVDIDGRPPNSVDIVVEGGTVADIAAAIFDVVAAGIERIGTISEDVIDSQGFTQTQKFSRPTDVDIFLEVDLTTDVNLFPANGVAQAEAALLAFGNALTIGQDVIVFPSLLCSLDSIPGITDVTIRIGESASPTLDDNIPIEAREIAAFDSSRITVVEL